MSDSTNTTPDLSTFAARLEALASWGGVKPARLGLLAGLSKSHVGQVLRGDIKKLRDDGIEKVCDLTGASRAWLSFGEGDPPEASTVRDRLKEADSKSKTAAAA